MKTALIWRKKIGGPKTPSPQFCTPREDDSMVRRRDGCKETARGEEETAREETAVDGGRFRGTLVVPPGTEVIGEVDFGNYGDDW